MSFNDLTKTQKTILLALYERMGPMHVEDLEKRSRELMKLSEEELVEEMRRELTLGRRQ